MNYREYVVELLSDPACAGATEAALRRSYWESTGTQYPAKDESIKVLKELKASGIIKGVGSSLTCWIEHP